jgi:hypothetical protein
MEGVEANWDLLYFSAVSFFRLEPGRRGRRREECRGRARKKEGGQEALQKRVLKETE